MLEAMMQMPDPRIFYGRGSKNEVGILRVSSDEITSCTRQKDGKRLDMQTTIMMK